MIKNNIKNIIPEYFKNYLVKLSNKRKRHYINSLPKINEIEFDNILKNILNVQIGDVVFIHSSIDSLNLGFPSYLVLQIILEAVGETGTILFPTYPKGTSQQFAESGTIFDVRKTPTYTGLLNEFARRHKSALRSLHPTKSVVAIGPKAEELIKDHQQSPYPYDISSPYYKITENKGKIIGIGVQSTYLSCVHCVDDLLKNKFPVNPYLDKLFDFICKDYDNQQVIVNTYIHEIRKMDFNLPHFFKKYSTKDVCEDINIKGMNFFKADSYKVFNTLYGLCVSKNITIYKKVYYK